jgi:hypothetical protein
VARAFVARALFFGTSPFEVETLNTVMPALVAGIHVLAIVKI